MAADKSAKTAAGLRGAFWDPARIPSGVRFHPANIVAEDGGAAFGMLAKCGGEKCVVMAMHPREFLATHYLGPEILRGGAAFWTQAPRSVGNDIRLEHETALLDVAAGIGYLRDQGYERIVLLGNSGGAGLFSFYCQQANLPSSARIVKTPAGKPTHLSGAALPKADGLVFVSPHPGQGALLMNCIDPSVTDENDPLSIDPSLFPFSPENGFKAPPSSSAYAPEFVARYRAAQRDRVARLDEWARARVADRIGAKRRLKEAFDPADMILSAHTPVLTIWRTDADLRCFDLSLDPSDRRYGSLWGANPFVSNFGSIGFARTCTADSWLSTWSGLSSNALLEKTAPGVVEPTFMFVFTGDNSVFPEDADNIFDWVGAADKTRASAPGDHHGRALTPDGPSGQMIAGEAIRAWLEDRFV
ncbi:MAG: alpha/beta hydrolase [Pseudomonadota bacterium]